ncbi:Uncharacterized protein TCAP_01979 [Tolypocladium capitatum]|uniref:Uncharacterized protein n=1 Tax=Tolypocladium capitatum TaxID=45235 RepID=A0A2K3QKN5_9HYPO|nr:Uncharacterized protein TCAP_01979 [Tolypocladium capitatum]
MPATPRPKQAIQHARCMRAVGSVGSVGGRAAATQALTWAGVSVGAHRPGCCSWASCGSTPYTYAPRLVPYDGPRRQGKKCGTSAHGVDRLPFAGPQLLLDFVPTLSVGESGSRAGTGQERKDRACQPAARPCLLAIMLNKEGTPSCHTLLAKLRGALRALVLQVDDTKARLSLYTSPPDQPTWRATGYQPPPQYIRRKGLAIRLSSGAELSAQAACTHIPTRPQGSHLGIIVSVAAKKKPAARRFRRPPPVAGRISALVPSKYTHPPCCNKEVGLDITYCDCNSYDNNCCYDAFVFHLLSVCPAQRGNLNGTSKAPPAPTQGSRPNLFRLSEKF